MNKKIVEVVTQSVSALLITLLLANFISIFASRKHKSSSSGPFKADAVKLSATDLNKILWRINTTNPDDKDKLSSRTIIVEDYGQFVIAMSSADDELAEFVDKNKIETEIHLPGSKFEPLRDFAHNLVENNIAEKDYYIVQFISPVRDKWLEDLKSIGAQTIQYVPNNAFFVYADSNQIHK
ncbi:MAG: hypothetical protein D6735_04485, partial [Acidobacteria bacterium]